MWHSIVATSEVDVTTTRRCPSSPLIFSGNARAGHTFPDANVRIHIRFPQ
jgi:hypothetical protein